MIKKHVVHVLLFCLFAKRSFNKRALVSQLRLQLVIAAVCVNT